MNGIWTPDPETSLHLARARAALSANRLEDALRALMDGFLRTQAASPRGIPLPAGWPAADRLLIDISRCFGQNPAPRSYPDGPDVFVATRLYSVGGHTAVLTDYFRSSDAGHKHILLNGMAGDASINKALGIRLGETAEAIEICPTAGLVETTAWLHRRLEELGPRRVFLFHHPEDVPAVVAVAAHGAQKCYIVHHADGAPGVGLHVPGFRIIDLAPFPAWFSRHMLGLENLYLPLAVDDPGPPPGRPPNKKLRTCTHGSAVKFTETGPCAFASVIASVLQRSGGEHLHVGPLDENRLELLRRALEREKISPDRFIHVKRVPTLVPVLREHRVDLSLGSFPIGGARGHIDMMSGGIPHVIYLDDPAHAPWKLHLLVPGARHWTSLEDLLALLDGASPEWLAGQSALMRAHFLRYHDARDFGIRLATLDYPTALPPVPSMPAETRDIWLSAAGGHGSEAR